MGEEDCARKTGLYAPWVLKKRRLVVIEFNGLRFRKFSIVEGGLRPLLIYGAPGGARFLTGESP